MDESLSGAELIAAERQRHGEGEGWTADGDSRYTGGELVSAARAYTSHALCLYAPDNPAAAPAVNEPPVWPYWPWDAKFWKPTWNDGGIRDLVKAGSLIAAEIDRLQAAAKPAGEVA